VLAYSSFRSFPHVGKKQRHSHRIGQVEELSANGLPTRSSGTKRAGSRRRRASTMTTKRPSSVYATVADHPSGLLSEGSAVRGDSGVFEDIVVADSAPPYAQLAVAGDELEGGATVGAGE
jgi:hypothetical protein